MTFAASDDDVWMDFTATRQNIGLSNITLGWSGTAVTPPVRGYQYLLIDLGPFSHVTRPGYVFHWIKSAMGFFIPGVLLTFFNIRLIQALRRSERLRRPAKRSLIVPAHQLHLRPAPRNSKHLQRHAVDHKDSSLSSPALGMSASPRPLPVVDGVRQQQRPPGHGDAEDDSRHGVAQPAQRDPGGRDRDARGAGLPVRDSRLRGPPGTAWTDDRRRRGGDDADADDPQRAAAVQLRAQLLSLLHAQRPVSTRVRRLVLPPTTAAAGRSRTGGARRRRGTRRQPGRSPKRRPQTTVIRCWL